MRMACIRAKVFFPGDVKELDCRVCLQLNNVPNSAGAAKRNGAINFGCECEKYWEVYTPFLTKFTWSGDYHDFACCKNIFCKRDACGILGPRGPLDQWVVNVRDACTFNVALLLVLFFCLPKRKVPKEKGPLRQNAPHAEGLALRWNVANTIWPRVVAAVIGMQELCAGVWVGKATQ